MSMRRQAEESLIVVMSWYLQCVNTRKLLCSITEENLLIFIYLTDNRLNR